MGDIQDMDKHLQYHCHLSGNEKVEISLGNDEEQTINRRNSYHHGIQK